MKRIAIFLVWLVLFGQPMSVAAWNYPGGLNQRAATALKNKVERMISVTSVSYTAREGEAFGFNYQTPNLDGDGQLGGWIITIVDGVLPDGSTLTQVAYDGREFRWTPSYNAAPGPYKFTIRAEDQKGVVRKTVVVIAVIDVSTYEDIEITGQHPASPLTIAELTAETYSVTTNKPGGTHVYTWFVNNINVQNNGAALVDFAFGPDMSGLNSVRCDVTDSQTSDSATWNVTVTDYDLPFVAQITSVFGDVAGQEVLTTVETNRQAVFTAEVTKGGQPINSLVDQLGDTSATVVFTPVDTGQYVIDITATDDQGETAVVTTTIDVMTADTGDTTPPTVLDAYYIGVENNNGTTADVVVTVPVGTTFNPRVVGDLIGGGLWSYASGLVPDSVVGNQARFNNVHVTSLVDFGIYTSNGVVFPYSEVEADWEVYLVTTDGYTYHLRLK